MPRHTLLNTLLAAVAGAGLLFTVTARADQTLLNSSYDIARELFAAINPKFQQHWEAETGETVTINQSHGGTSRQAQAILQGLRADVVTYNQVTDIDMLAKRGLVAEDWQSKLPNNSSPYYSTTAFLVREGNPKNIRSWDDLVREDVRIVFPNPKTSGNGRYTYLAAWLFAHKQFDGDDAKIRDFMSKFLRNVAVFDTGGRGATVTFAERGIGDVLISFESEVRNIRREYGDGDYTVVVPPVSILAEFPVAVVDRVVDAQGSRKLAQAYLDYLYSPEIQRLLAEFSYRVHDPEVVKATADQFPEVELLRVEDVFGSWDAAQEQHFGRDAVLDQLQARGR